MAMQRIGVEKDADAGLHVQFRHVAKVDDAATLERGETTWVDVEYITITIPGDRNFIFDGPVTAEHRGRFSTKYERWVAGKGQALDGTPLSAWPSITPAELNTLAQGGIHTVEGLAALSDGNAGSVGPVLALRAKARKYLAAARESAPIEALNLKLQEKDAKINALSEQMQGLMERLDRLASASQAPEAETAGDPAAPAKRGPGRPPNQPRPPQG